MANNIFDDLIKSVEKLIKKHERGIKQDYKAAYRRLRNKPQKIYADYENGEETKLTRDELRKLDADTAKIMANMYKGNEKAVQNTLESVLNASYSAVNTITSKYNIDAVVRKIDANNIIKKQVAGHIWTERIKKYGNDFVYDVHGIIHQGLDNGDTYTTTARKLKERFGKDIGNTMRIARTESARVLEDSKYQAFEDLANNDSVQVFKIWHTMGDEAVRDTHDAMEGVKVAYDEDFILPSGAKCQYPKGTGVAAEDINCRCYVEYVTELVKDEKDLEKSSEKWYNIDEEDDKAKKDVVKDIATKEIDKIKPEELKITDDLKTIASANDAELAGLQYRFKSVDSLARKIKTDAAEKEISFKEAANLITDKLRYTIVSKPEQFTDNYFKTVNTLKQKGYEVIRVKNTFKDGVTYKGLNTLVKNNKGVIFELQYHTSQSLQIKENELHKLYEKQRILPNSSKEYDDLKKEMIDISSRIVNPKGVEKIE